MALENSTATQSAQYSDVISYLCEKDYSNEAVTVASGQDLEVGAVLGRILTPTIVRTGATGNGTISALTLGMGIKEGRYTATFTSTGATATANLTDPAGKFLGVITVGTAFVCDDFAVTFSDGATDFDDNDVVYWDVVGSTVEALDQAGTDGTQVAFGILLANVDATAAAQKSAAVVRGEVLINTDGLKWNNTITTAQKNVAIAQMKRNGLVFRNGI